MTASATSLDFIAGNTTAKNYIALIALLTKSMR
jgi:hypothetical protein